MCASLCCSDQAKLLVVIVAHCISVLLNNIGLGAPPAETGGEDRNRLLFVVLVCSFLRPTQDLHIRKHAPNTLTSHYPNNACN